MRKMSMQRFLDQVYEGYLVGKRYCFILGSGASRSSGIRTGMEMMREWWDYLRESPRGVDYIKECAEDLIQESSSNGNGLKEDYFKRFYDKKYKLKNSDYFDLFDLRFVTMRDAGYQCLEHEMEDKTPSYGYFALATILANTENRLVITTNFDSLSEDALFIYTKARPQVVGHESLAQYMGAHFQRPVIAKVHRGLYFNPLNRQEETGAIQTEWKKPLHQAFEKYIPIVIGYGGGDRSLMSYLEDEDNGLQALYWCDICDLPKNSEPAKLVEKKNGYFIKIGGFDELMFEFGEKFNEEAKFSDPKKRMRDETERRCALYDESFNMLSEKCRQLRKQGADDAPSSGGDAEQSELAKSIQSFANRSLAELDQVPESQRNAEYYTQYGELLKKACQFGKAIESFDKAIELDPNNAEYYHNKGFSEIMTDDYENAIASYTHAIKLDNNEGDHYYYRSKAYYDLKKYDEALADINISIKLDPDGSFSYLIRADTNYALGNIKEIKTDMLTALAKAPALAYMVKDDIADMPNLPEADRKAIEKEIKRCEKQS